VQDNLRQWKTGGFRRPSADRPFGDVIRSSPTPKAERKIAPHPSLKPQAFMRELVRASLPLGHGIVLDPFMGGGSTIAAAMALGYASIGLEKDAAYFGMAMKAIPDLADLTLNRARQTADLVDLYFEQANVFSAIIGIFGVKALHAVSPYKKHKHPDVAQQRLH
jgi:tRNA G10  N-methylase Trm11